MAAAATAETGLPVTYSREERGSTGWGEARAGTRLGVPRPFCRDERGAVREDQGYRGRARLFRRRQTWGFPRVWLRPVT